MNNMIFDKQTDYKVAFEQAVDELITHDELSQSERNLAVETLCEAYVVFIDERPNPYQLERLANYVLFETMKDTRKNKMKLDEYPVLTETQYNRRRKHEVDFDITIGRFDSDGVDRTLPKRKRRKYDDYKFIKQQMDNGELD